MGLAPLLVVCHRSEARGRTLLGRPCAPRGDQVIWIASLHAVLALGSAREFARCPAGVFRHVMMVFNFILSPGAKIAQVRYEIGEAMALGTRSVAASCVAASDPSSSV